VPVLEVCSGLVVNLQFGVGVSEEIATVGGNVRIVEMPDLNTRDDIESVAALMCELDIVVTVPGTTMHLAGAVGARTLAVTHPSEVLWRARSDGRTGTWCPSIEVVSGPPNLGFDGAILAASQRLRTLLLAR
jgi:spore coat polysaccharide biosynthesis predicted glycosyltransferase SpsG